MLSAGYKDKAALERALAVAIDNFEVYTTRLHAACNQDGIRSFIIQAVVSPVNFLTNPFLLACCRGSGCNKRQVVDSLWLQQLC